MKRFQVKAMCWVLIDVGSIEAGSFAAAEEGARRLVAEHYPSGRVVFGGQDLNIEAALAVREEARRPA